uniref:Uncharacterized protein n=1 Tax=Leersia perrieri TaxID=77586 RepID=A0A0D9VM63_9ORYZ
MESLEDDEITLISSSSSSNEYWSAGRSKGHRYSSVTPFWGGEESRRRKRIQCEATLTEDGDDC